MCAIGLMTCRTFTGRNVKPRMFGASLKFIHLCYTCHFTLIILFFINQIFFPQMPSVTLKDVDQQKFVKAFAAFLKK